MVFHRVRLVCCAWICLVAAVLADSDIDDVICEIGFSIPGINLDLLEVNVTELTQQEETYKARLQNISILEESGKKSAKNVNVIDLDSQNLKVTKYEMSKRSSLGSKQMKHVIRHNPKSIIFFKDTKTVLIADRKQIMEEDDDVLQDKIKRGESLKFVEYDTDNSIKYGISPVLIPASPCLRFIGDQPTGSISIAYQVGVTVTFSGSIEGDYNVPLNTDYLTLALHYISGVSSAIGATFTGTYACDSVNGTDIRLFYKAGMIEAEPRSRNIIYDTFKGKVISKGWSRLPVIKSITNSQPIYYCASSDKMDLMCDMSGVDYTDESGVTFKSHIKH